MVWCGVCSALHGDQEWLSPWLWFRFCRYSICDGLWRCLKNSFGHSLVLNLEAATTILTGIWPEDTRHMAAGPMPRDSHTARSLQTSTQNVKYPCASWVRRLAQNDCRGIRARHFCCAHFHTEGFCEMSMCILSAQARAHDCRVFFCVRHFSCKFQHKLALVKRRAGAEMWKQAVSFLFSWSWRS